MIDGYLRSFPSSSSSVSSFPLDIPCSITTVCCERLSRDIDPDRDAVRVVRELGDFIREDRGEDFALFELVFERHGGGGRRAGGSSAVGGGGGGGALVLPLCPLF